MRQQSQRSRHGWSPQLIESSRAGGWEGQLKGRWRNSSIEARGNATTPALFEDGLLVVIPRVAEMPRGGRLRFPSTAAWGLLGQSSQQRLSAPSIRILILPEVTVKLASIDEIGKGELLDARRSPIRKQLLAQRPQGPGGDNEPTRSEARVRVLRL